MWETMPCHVFVPAALPCSKAFFGWLTSWAPGRFCFCCKPAIFGKKFLQPTPSLRKQLIFQ